MIALGVLAAVWLCGRRLEQRGVGQARGRRQDRRLGGDRRRHRLPPVPRGHRLGALRGPLVATSSKIWQGGLGIPGGMFAGVVAGISPPSATASSPADASRARRPRCRSPRRSGAGATGSTRSCTAAPTDAARGRSRSTTSTCRAGLRRPARRSTRRSSTSRCGTSGCAGSCCGSTAAGSCAAGAARAVRRSATASAGSGREPAHRPRPRDRRPADEPVGGDHVHPRWLRIRRLGDRRRRPLPTHHPTGITGPGICGERDPAAE